MGACASKFSVSNTPIDAPLSEELKPAEETVKAEVTRETEEADRRSLGDLFKQDEKESSNETLAKQQENENVSNPDPVAAAASAEDETKEKGVKSSTQTMEFEGEGSLEKTEEKLAETTKPDGTEELAEAVNLKVDDRPPFQTINSVDESAIAEKSEAPVIESENLKPDLDKGKDKEELQLIDSTNALVSGPLETEKIEEQRVDMTEEKEKQAETPELETRVLKESEEHATDADAEKQKTEERVVETTNLEAPEVSTSEKYVECTINSMKSSDEKSKIDQQKQASDAEQSLK